MISNEVIQQKSLLELIKEVRFEDIIRISHSNKKLYKDLDDNIINWKQLDDNYAFLIINEGLKFELIQSKSKEFFNNMELFTSNSSVKKEDRVLLNEHIKEYLERELIEEVKEEERIFNSNVFFVYSEKRSTKTRLILNMKRLNTFVEKRSFTLLKINEIFNYIERGAYAIVIDISKAYYHIKINKDFQNYFAFIFNDKRWKFKVMPFGFTNAPYIFTKVTEPIWKFLRKNFNIIIFAYLDDILIISETEEKCKQNATRTLALLALLGFNINFKKLVIQPTQRFTYLGVIIDTNQMIVENTEDNKLKSKRKVKEILQNDTITRRELESLLGLLNFMSQFIKEGRQFLFPLMKIINKLYNFDRDAKMTKSVEVEESIKRWLNEESYSHKKLLPQIITITMRTDASKNRWGATIETAKGLNEASNIWEKDCQNLNINNKELLAVKKAILSFGELIRDQHMAVYIDNKTAVACLKKRGTNKNTFRNRIVREILEILLSLNVTIEVHHIKGKKNILADLHSRSNHIIPSELEISEELYWKISEEFGLIPEIDLFASPYSKKCMIFTSSIPDKKAISLNAFTINWGFYNVLYAFPPPTLISKILFKWKREKRGKMILIAPAWPSKVWFPILMELKEREWILPIRERDCFLRTVEGISYISAKKFHLTGYIL